MNTVAELEKVVQCYLSSYIPGKLIIVDNSPTDILRKYCSSERIEYIHNPINPGFGASHNITIAKSIESGAKYHLVLNPDVYFKSDVLEKVINFLEENNDVGQVMPKVLYPCGRTQYLPKLLPTPLRLFLRKMPLPRFFFRLINDNYEYRFLKHERAVKTPIVSGCFSLFRVEVLKKIGGYDERFFMYFEDFDISRRAYNVAKNIYLPNIHIYHEYGRGANKSLKLFKIFVVSALNYFNKWGWFFDRDRVKINLDALRDAKKK